MNSGKSSLNKKSRLLWAAGLMVAGVFLYFVAIGMKVIGVWCMALSLVVLFYLLLAVEKERFPRLCRVLDRVTTYGLILFFMLYAGTAVVLVSNTSYDNSGEAEYFIVLGAQVNGEKPSGVLQDRLDTALAELKEHPGTSAILCGGKGSGEDITEARCMAEYLSENGIGEDRLLLEETSTRTVENLFNAKTILQNRGEDPKTVSVTVITNEFHMMRSLLLASRLRMNAGGVEAESSNKIILLNHYAREVLALWNSLLEK